MGARARARRHATLLVSLFRGGRPPRGGAVRTSRGAGSVRCSHRLRPRSSWVSPEGPRLAASSARRASALVRAGARSRLPPRGIRWFDSPRLSVLRPAPRPTPPRARSSAPISSGCSCEVRSTSPSGIAPASFPETFVFLFAEQLLGVAAEAFDAWEQGRSYNRRTDLAGISLGIRSIAETKGAQPDAESTLSEPGTWLTLGGTRASSYIEARTFRVPDGAALAEGVVSFGRALCTRALASRPCAKAKSPPVGVPQRASRSRRAAARCRARRREGQPERPRCTAPSAASLPRRLVGPSRRGEAALLAGWTASFGGIDLRATFLCGDRLIVGASRETACVDRRTGESLWRRPTQPAVSVVTPEGLARLFPDGSIALHDFGSGEIVVTATRVAPRVGGVVTGAVVSAPGLPRLLVVSEGKRRLSAVDLANGRGSLASHVARRIDVSAPPRRQAAGRRRRRRDAHRARHLRRRAWCGARAIAFASSRQVGLDHDSLFALAGEPGRSGRGRLPAPPSRSLRRCRAVGSRSSAGRLAPSGLRSSPIARSSSSRAIAAASVSSRSIGPAATTLWSSEPGRFPVASAWLTIDDAVVMSSERGDLLSLATRTGATQWRHRFPRGMEGDQPRKLEPILRSGALFVPAAAGPRRPSARRRASSAWCPTNLIPDLLRVDEHCDVYIAEESGHLAVVQGAGAKLCSV